MTRENAKKQAEVMLAYAEGKDIQVMDCFGTWEDAANPLFDWSSRQYRIKPEPDFVPYKDAYEFMKALISHSRSLHLCLKDLSGYTRSIEQIDFTDNTVKISTSPIRPQDDSQWYRLNVVLESFTFTDDAKCGLLNNSTKN